MTMDKPQAASLKVVLDRNQTIRNGQIMASKPDPADPDPSTGGGRMVYCAWDPKGGTLDPATKEFIPLAAMAVADVPADDSGTAQQITTGDDYGVVSVFVGAARASGPRLDPAMLVCGDAVSADDLAVAVTDLQRRRIVATTEK
jgi:hypothetical protein